MVACFNVWLHHATIKESALRLQWLHVQHAEWGVPETTVFGVQRVSKQEEDKENKLSSVVGTSISPTKHRGAWLH